MTDELRVIPLRGIPELEDGDDLGALIVAAAASAGGFEEGDVLVVAQKAVSKVEGRVVQLEGVEPSDRARELAGDADPRRLEVILGESREILRSRPPLVIAETHHGFVCASAGVDASNARGPDTLVLLPLDPDASADALRAAVRERTGVDVSVIVSDSFGRAWRTGQTDVAIGAAGVQVVDDWRGRTDRAGRELRATTIAAGDAIAGAADLARAKDAYVPAVLVRGLERLVTAADGPGAAPLRRNPDEDLFR